jgi:hypothetical protein
MSEHDHSGKSPHAFMREAMTVQSRLLAQRRAFVTAALLADRAALRDGTGFLAAEVDAYFDARSQELPAPPPLLRSWRT